MVAGVAGAAPTPPSAAAANSIGLRLVEGPATEGSDLQSSIYIVDHVAPGTILHRQIQVSNTTSSAVPIVLYAAAASISKGAFLGASGHTPNDVSTWTSVSPGSAQVLAGGLLTANVTIVVPRDAAPGQRYGIVWAETRSAPMAGGGVIQVSRVGIRIYLSVAKGGSPAPDFTVAPLSAKRSPNGQPMVVTTVHNTGGWALDVAGTLRLTSGPGGLNAGPLSVTLGSSLAIGHTEPVTIALDKGLPDGPWKALITVHSGLLDRSAGATITFPDATSPPPRWLYPVIVALGVLLVLGFAILFVGLGRRRPHHRRGSHRPLRLGAKPVAASHRATT